MVQRGERATTVVFWQFPRDPAVKNIEAEDAADGDPRSRPWARAYAVFNAAQVEGAKLPTNVSPHLSNEARIAAAERFFASLPDLTVRHGGTSAFYAPGSDHVQLPPFAAFRTAEGYYGTVAHEVIHWTGAPSRLARDLSGRFGTTAYAAEELVAELGAAFICSRLGFATQPRQDHAQYIARWLEVLRADKRAVFTAAGRAQAAADWLYAAHSYRRALELTRM